MSRLLPMSRYLVLLAVTGCFLAAAALFAYGLLAVVRVLVAMLASDIAHLGDTEHDVVATAEHLAVALIQLADVFLLGTVIYLVGLGLHLLFINPRLPAQPWLAVQDLDDLKEMLVRVIVLLVGVTFLGSFVEKADDVPMWDLSVATALVVVAFSLVILVSKLPNWSRTKEADGFGRHGAADQIQAPEDAQRRGYEAAAKEPEGFSVGENDSNAHHGRVQSRQAAAE